MNIRKIKQYVRTPIIRDSIVWAAAFIVSVWAMFGITAIMLAFTYEVETMQGIMDNETLFIIHTYGE